MNSNTSDEILISAYKNGNKKGIEVLINKYRIDVYRFIYTKVNTNEIADDLFQETFIKVIIALKQNSYNEKGKLLSYIFRIANNLIIDYYRKSKKEIFFKLDDNLFMRDRLKSEILDISELVRSEKVYKIVESNLIKIPLEQQEVIELRLFKQKSFKEIAKLQGVNINTALGRYRYAINNLKNEVLNDPKLEKVV
jgi:RNA polymerase sigma-70 factor (ECF subfamily)